MKFAPIGDCFERIKNGYSISNSKDKGGIPLTRIETISDGTIDFSKVGYADIFSLSGLEEYLVQEGDILMSHINSVKHLGKVAIFDSSDKQMIHAMNLLLLRTNEYLNAKFAYYYFTSKGFKSDLSRIIKRAVNQASFSTSNFKNLQIPLPPLATQRRIAEVLDKADAIRKRSKKMLEKYDQLAQSAFLEMFGDPVTNEKGWETQFGENVLAKCSVGVVIKPASHYAPKGVLALRSLNVKANSFDLTDTVYFKSESHHKLSKSILKENDVVIVRTGITGTAAVIPKYLEGANCIDLIITRPEESKLNPFYFSCFLNSERGKQLVTGKEVGGIHKHFNVGAMKKLEMPIPPLNLQNEFELRFKHIQQQKKQARAELDRAETLYQSLLQRAFTGELFSEETTKELQNA